LGFILAGRAGVLSGAKRHENNAQTSAAIKQILDDLVTLTAACPACKASYHRIDTALP
jgi:hypothetical protein